MRKETRQQRADRLIRELALRMGRRLGTGCPDPYEVRDLYALRYGPTERMVRRFDLLSTVA